MWRLYKSVRVRKQLKQMKMLSNPHLYKLWLKEKYEKFKHLEWTFRMSNFKVWSVEVRCCSSALKNFIWGISDTSMTSGHLPMGNVLFLLYWKWPYKKLDLDIPLRRLKRASGSPRKSWKRRQGRKMFELSLERCLCDPVPKNKKKKMNWWN